MDSEKFDLVFSGDLVRGAELQQSKLNLGRLFKIPENKVDALFSGKPIVLKKDLDFATANKYRVAIKKAGCRVDLVEKPTSPPVDSQKSADQRSSSDPVSPTVAVTAPSIASSSDALANSESNRSSEPTLPLPEVREETTVSSNEGSFDLAPVGSDVLSEKEKHSFVPVDIDTSNIVLRETGADLLDESERGHDSVSSVSALNADIAPVGSDLLSDSEKTQDEILELDLSEFSLSEVGADLGEIKEQKEVAIPDISHLSVE